MYANNALFCKSLMRNNLLNPVDLHLISSQIVVCAPVNASSQEGLENALDLHVFSTEIEIPQ